MLLAYFSPSYEEKTHQQANELYSRANLILGDKNWEQEKKKIHEHCAEKSYRGLFAYTEELQEIYNKLASGRNLDSILQENK